MKKSELRQLIREELKKSLTDEDYDKWLDNTEEFIKRGESDEIISDIIEIQGGFYEISGNYDLNMDKQKIETLLLWYNFYAAYIGDLGQRNEANDKNKKIASQLEEIGITDFKRIGRKT